MVTRRDGNPLGRLDFERLGANAMQPIWSVGEAMSDSLPSFLGRVVTPSSLLRGGRFCKVVPTATGGAEAEGKQASFATLATGSAGATSSPPVLVYLMGSFLPSTGDLLVCRFVDHRWVAEATGGSVAHGTGVLLPSCFCSVPAALQMTSANASCNYGMFQSCTLAYGPPPASLAAAGVSGEIFASTSTFYDPVTFRNFYYYFTCYYNQFFLTRIYPPVDGQAALFDGILYNWIVGDYANTCTPFLLNYGMPYPGSDASCSVSISGS